MKHLSILALFAALMGMVVSCGKATVDSENTRWKSSQERISKLKQVYPSFSTALDNVLKEAEAAIKAAGSISDEKQKIDAMSAANNLAAPQFVTDLDGMDRLFRDLTDQISKAKQAGGDANDKTAINDASYRADNAIREAKTQLSSANPTDAAGANAIVNIAKSNVEAAKRTLSDLVSAAEKKVNDAKKAATDEKAANDKKAEDDKKAMADIKCVQCGNMNKAGTLKCSGCGAPIEKK